MNEQWFNPQWFNPQWLWFLIPIGFVAFWCAICGLISLGGWAQLAKDFRAENVTVGSVRAFQSLIIGAAKYNGALSIGVWPEGLYIRPMAIFRVGHPPLLIPWSAIGTPKQEKVLWSQVWICEVQTRHLGRVKITIGQRGLAEAIAAYCGATDVI